MAEPTEADLATAREIAEYFAVDHLESEAAEAIARALRDARSSSTGWVPVGERMPEQGETVVAIVPGRFSRGVTVTYSPRGTGLDWDGFPYDNVTHWMRIPALPSDGETGGGR